jgi:hypothetical protein
VPPFNKASRPFRLRWTPKVAAFEELINGTWEPASPQLESLLVKDKNLNVDDLRAMVTAPNVVIDFILGPKRGPVPVGISISE